MIQNRFFLCEDLKSHLEKTKQTKAQKNNSIKRDKNRMQLVSQKTKDDRVKKEYRSLSTKFYEKQVIKTNKQINK